MAKINPIQLQKYLKGVSYPASKQTLIETATKHEADDKMREALERLPDQEYDTPAAVSKAIGKDD